jgi:hypothetical protein
VPSASNIGAKTRQIPSSPMTYWGRSDGLAQFGSGNSTTLIPAKEAADVDLFSDGRLRLGVRVGWNWVEYARVLVFPEPAPAMTRSGAPGATFFSLTPCSTARRYSRLRL